MCFRASVSASVRPQHPDYDMPDWVLGTLHGDDQIAVNDAAARAAEACAVYIRDGGGSRHEPL